jgi:hypothetical protein
MPSILLASLRDYRGTLHTPREEVAEALADRDSR